MIIKKHRHQLIQYGRGTGTATPKLSKWQRAKTGVGKVGRSIPKGVKTVIVAPTAAAVALPKAAIAGTVTGIGSTLYSPVRLIKATGKTLYHGTKGLGQEAKRFIAWRQYKSAKAKLEKAQSTLTDESDSGSEKQGLSSTSSQPENIQTLQTKKNNLYRKLKASTGRVNETRKQIGKSLLNVVKDVTPYRIYANGVRGSIESLKKTAKYTGKHFDIIGSDKLKTLKPTSMANIIMGTKTKKQQPQVNIGTLTKTIQRDLARKGQGDVQQEQVGSQVKAKAADYLALERLQKQQAIKGAKIQKIMKTEQNEYNKIEQEYIRNISGFNDNFKKIQSEIGRLALQIPTLGMFDPNRARLQKEYDEALAKFKLYDAVKTV